MKTEEKKVVKTEKLETLQEESKPAVEKHRSGVATRAVENPSKESSKKTENASELDIDIESFLMG